MSLPIIRKAQIAAFKAEALREYRRRLSLFIASRFPSVVAPVREAVIDHAFASARKLGLSSEQAVAEFVALAVELGPNFAEHPKIRSVLHEERFPPDVRMKVLAARLTEALKEEIRTSSLPLEVGR